MYSNEVDDLAIGSVLNNWYRIKKRLGGGGWGITYLAEDTLSNNRYCVVKEIYPSPDLSPEDNQRLFNNEATALYNLGKHPQIPELYDYFKNNNKFYLIQEYLCGITLQNKLKNKQTYFIEPEVISILKEILLILKEVHRHNYLHLDIKPSNIICRSPDNKLFLIDFGAVKKIPTTYNNSGHYQSKLIIGTPGYMAPEQTSNQPICSSDIYALGITAINLLTGLHPPGNHFDSSNSMEIDSNNAEIIWLDKVKVAQRKIHPQLVAILNKMVRFDFKERYNSVDRVLQDLERHSSDSINPVLPDFERDPKSSILDSIIIKIQNIYSRLISSGLRRSIIIAISVALLIIIPKIIKIGNSDIPEKPKDSTEETINISENPLSNIEQPINTIENSTSSIKETINISEELGISTGEEIINPTLANSSLIKEGTEFYSREEYQKAADKFKEYWNDNKDPEVLIYLNNTLLELANKEYYTIAISVPMTSTKPEDSNEIKNIHIAPEILRGVAQLQTKINLGLGINELPGRKYLNPESINNKGIKIIIADDSNDKEKAKNIAIKLIQHQDILGVIGNYASDLTLETIDIFNKHKTTLISPTSNSEKLIDPHREFFFITIPTVTDFAENLKNYLINKIGLKKVAIFYNPHSPYTKSFYEVFKEVFTAMGGDVVLEYDDLYKQDFNIDKALEEINKQEDIAIVLFPDGQVSQAFNNALQIIKQDRGKHQILGGETLYSTKTLDINDFKTLEKLLIPVPWNPLSSPNQTFTEQTKKLWHGSVNHRTALTYDAASTFSYALEILSNDDRPINRISIQQTIANNKFNTLGATGTIRFTNKGNRKTPNLDLVKVIKCDRKIRFIPISIDRCPSS